MSTTTVTEKAPLTSQANTFITVLAVKEDTPAEKPKQTPVFLLNSSDFIALQLYLQAGLELPATPELFESHYPKDAFDKYTKVDTGLYGGLKSQLVLTHEHCEKFQGEVVGPMITTGGNVANFGDDANKFMSDILRAIDTITSKDVTDKDPRFGEAKTLIKNRCIKLKSRADTLGGECDTLVKQLETFRAQTESDKKSLEGLNERLTKAMPSKEAQDQELKSLLQKAKELYEATRSEIEKTHQEAIEAGEDHWYYYIPIVGACILIYNVIKQGKLMDKIKDIQDAYNQAREKGKEDLLKTTQAFTTINHLTAEVGRILSTIDGAINSVNRMKVSFSNISSTFSKIRNQIGDVQGDVDSTDLEERGLARDDLADAQKTWGEVSVLAKAFQLHGGLLKFDEKTSGK